MLELLGGGVGQQVRLPGSLGPRPRQCEPHTGLGRHVAARLLVEEFSAPGVVEHNLLFVILGAVWRLPIRVAQDSPMILVIP